MEAQFHLLFGQQFLTDGCPASRFDIVPTGIEQSPIPIANVKMFVQTS